jgi:hypothetical protein
MKSFVTQNELGRRVGMPVATLKLRLQQNEIEPDGVVINGQKTAGLIFDCARLATLRRQLTPSLEANTR